LAFFTELIISARLKSRERWNVRAIAGAGLIRGERRDGQGFALQLSRAMAIAPRTASVTRHDWRGVHCEA
jgi:hypothetical protein